MISEKLYQLAADRLGVQAAAIKAFATVESSGSGFLPDGTPKILFERHVMYRRVAALHGQTTADDLANRFPDLINKSPFIKYKPQSEQHAVLDAAVKLDRQCALESCSWGAFQIMGYHWEYLGYKSIQDFVNAMYADEEHQLEAFISFVSKQSALVGAIKSLNFDKAAEIYNGKNYKRFNYAEKMRTEFIKNGGK